MAKNHQKVVLSLYMNKQVPQNLQNIGQNRRKIAKTRFTPTKPCTKRLYSIRGDFFPQNGIHGDPRFTHGYAGQGKTASFSTRIPRHTVVHEMRCTEMLCKSELHDNIIIFIPTCTCTGWPKKNSMNFHANSTRSSSS